MVNVDNLYIDSDKGDELQDILDSQPNLTEQETQKIINDFFLKHGFECD